MPIRTILLVFISILRVNDVATISKLLEFDFVSFAIKVTEM